MINCIGILISGSNSNPENAIFLNAYLPHRLVRLSNDIDAKLIHISTDCVFSGNKGTPYIETDIKDGKIKNVLEYYSNGQLRSEENWIDGKKYMIERGWYENGQLRYEYNSKDIKDELSVRTNSGGFGRKMFKDGTQRDWNENGQLMYEGNWKDGKEDGLSKWWYDHGQLINEQNYIDGKKDGLSLIERILL